MDTFSRILCGRKCSCLAVLSSVLTDRVGGGNCCSLDQDQQEVLEYLDQVEMVQREIPHTLL